MDLSFISDSRALISDLIQFGAWFLILYRIYKKPEQDQDQKINAILEKLNNVEVNKIAELEMSIKTLLKRLFIRTCIDILKKGYATEADLEIVETLYHEYSVVYRMDGRGTELYKQVLELPLEEDGKEV